MFCDVPSPSPERDEYYKSIGNEFSSRSHYILVKLILTGKPLEIKILAEVFPGCKVEELGSELEIFLSILREKCNED